jgi:integrase
MPAPPRRVARIGLRDVNALAPGGIVWDGVVRGFGARRQRDAVVFFLKYRTTTGRQRWITIGKLGSPWTPTSARAEAQRLLGAIVAGADPAGEKQDRRKAITVAELCQRYLADADAGRILGRGGQPKKPLTLVSDRGRIEHHIVPLLGNLAVAAVTRRDVDRFMHAVAAGETRSNPTSQYRVRGGRGVATRTVGLLGAIFSFALQQGLRGDNPCARVRRFADGRRERRLSDAEYAALGAALRVAADAEWPPVVACLHFLSLTGWRSGEALGLRWHDVDVVRRTATLADTKTGRSVRALSRAACDLLRSQPRRGDLALVFPSVRGDGALKSFHTYVRRVVARGGLPPAVTAHTMRHSFASLASDLGYSEATIATLIGHRGYSVTSRYVHSADRVLLEAADAVAAAITERMGRAAPSGGEVVPMLRA